MRVVLIVFGVFAAVLIGNVAYCAYVMTVDLCENTAVHSVVAPDGRRRADVFVRGCGATTRSSTQISIVPVRTGPAKGAGNALIFERETPVRVRWLSAGIVEVSYPRSTTVLHVSPQVEGAKVAHGPFPPEGATDRP